jgi:catechol 2,3-dioxygenase-like lactoylglutathione lyase family enzyme
VPIQELFHLIHVVDDEEEVDAWYDEVFAPERFAPKHWLDGEKRWASLSMIGDFMIEVIEPSSAPEDQGMALSKFHNRFGQHFHSLAWYTDGATVRALFDRLRGHGIRIAKPGGGMFAAGDIDPGSTIYTHPKDTFGQLEFVDVANTWLDRDPRFQPGWSASYWRDEHPLGIERVSHLTTLVTDLDRARDLFTGPLEGTPLHAETSDTAASAFVLVGTDTLVELARPSGVGSRLAADLAANGELPHACTFKVRDLDAAERHVEKVGIRVADRRGDTFTADPADCFGAVYAFTTRVIPGDPRA